MVTGAAPGPATDVVTNENGFEIAEARTEAEVELTSSRTEAIRMEFEAEMASAPPLSIETVSFNPQPEPPPSG